MKLRKVLAAVVAAAVSASAMAVSSFAVLAEDMLFANGAPTVNVYKLQGVEGVDYSKVATIEAVVTTTDYVNGTIGVSANGAWTTPGQKEVKAGTATWVLDGLTGIDSTLDDGSLKEDVVQVQFWWLNAGSFSLDSLLLKDASGAILHDAANPPVAEPEAPVEPEVPEVPEEPETPVEPEEPETPVEPEAPEEPADEPEEPTEPEEPEALEPDWDAYDYDAALAANESFVFGVNDTIDLYALVGESWADLAKIDVTFVWNPELGWCGGAGLGNGATLEDGTAWISGPEYGCANANSAVQADGTATQTVVDLAGASLATIATVDEKTGETAFAKLFLQNWWNGAEAGAQVAAITAYDAAGDVIGAIEYDVEAPEAPTEPETPDEPEAPETPDTGKGSPDTGIEGIAVVAGAALLAGAAVVASRKRK